MKTLIVDDSRFQRLAIQRALGHAGYQVQTASDGEEAIKVASTSELDVIVLDMMLPRVSGIDVLRRLRGETKTREVPIIVLTGLSDRNKDKLLGEGASGFLEKSEALSRGDCTSLIREIARVTAQKQ